MTRLENFIQWVYDNWQSAGDTTSLSIIIATLLNILPNIAAILSIIWVGLRIYESETVQRILGRTNVNVDRGEYVEPNQD